MKLNINAKELLALYNVLYERFDGRQAYDEYKDEDSSVPTDEMQLRQVYNRLKAIIVAGLINPSKALDPVDSWLKHESVKINDLQRQNDELRAVTSDPDNMVSRSQLANILTDNEDEVSSDLGYPKPRKGPPGPNMPHQRKHRNRRK